MAQHRVLLLQAKDGEPIAELPHSGLSYGKVLTGVGTAQFTIPAGSEKAARSLIGPGLGREVAVIRNDDTCVWNGPLIKTTRGLAGDVLCEAADPGWYLSKRVTEGPRHFARPVLSAVANLVDMAQALPLAGQQKPTAYAPFYRLTVTPNTGGPIKRWAIASTDRLPILNVLADLADEDVAGFDWRWEWTYVRTGMQVSRIFRLGQPTLGTDRGTEVVLEPPHLLTYSEEESMERAANRVHVLGAGTGTGRKRAAAPNGTHAALSGVLYEAVVERSNVANQATLNGMANAYRRVLSPPTRMIQTTHRTTAQGGLAYGVVQMGDTVQVRAAGLDMRRRVVAENVTVDDAGEESIEWTYNDPTDEVVT